MLKFILGNTGKINIPLRFKNFWFWAGLIGVIIGSTGIDANTLTSWGSVGNLIVDVFSNPVRLAAVIVAIVGVISDPTTPGMSDSVRALGYK